MIGVVVSPSLSPNRRTWASVSENVRLLVHPHGRPVLRSGKGAFGLAENTIGAFDELVLYVAGMTNLDGIDRAGLRHQGIEATDAEKPAINS